MCGYSGQQCWVKDAFSTEIKTRNKDSYPRKERVEHTDIIMINILQFM